MTALILTLRERPAQRIDMRLLLPERLDALSHREIGAIRLRTDGGEEPLEALFDFDTDPGQHDESELIIRNACDRLDYIGAGQQSGRIRVEGDAGGYLGRGMAGGTIRVSGHTGPFAASGMSGGTIRIAGDAGDCLGAGIAGERLGMNRGVVVVGGNAGDRAGDRLRRGLILIEGNAGDYCGAQMIAGTLAVLGQVGDRAGYGMRRGTLLLSQAPRSLPPTFNDCGRHDLTFLTLLLSSIQRLDDSFRKLDASRKRVRRLVGDRACGGQGEVLIWV